MRLHCTQNRQLTPSPSLGQRCGNHHSLLTSRIRRMIHICSELTGTHHHADARPGTYPTFIHLPRQNRDCHHRTARHSYGMSTRRGTLGPSQLLYTEKPMTRSRPSLLPNHRPSSTSHREKSHIGNLTKAFARRRPRTGSTS